MGPPIRMYSKYERRTDTRTYEDRKKLYEGGWEVMRSETLDAVWKEKYDDWTMRHQKARRILQRLHQLRKKRKRRRRRRITMRRRKSKIIDFLLSMMQTRGRGAPSPSAQCSTL